MKSNLLSVIWRSFKERMSFKLQLMFISIVLVFVPTAIFGLISYQTFKHDAYIFAEREMEFISRDWMITAQVYVEQMNRILRREDAMAEKRLASIVLTAKKIFEYEESDEQDEDAVCPAKARLTSLGRSLAETRIGRSGHLFIMNTAGDFILPPPYVSGEANIFTGRTQRERSLWHSIVERVTALHRADDVYTVHYAWADMPGEEERERVTAFTYFPNEDLIIAATNYYTDYKSYELQRVLQEELKYKMAQQPIHGKGYLWVVNSAGDYVVSRGRLRDGENIMNIRDLHGDLVMQDMIEKVKELPPGDPYMKRYVWQNIEDQKPLMKMSVVRYIPAWDWILGVSLYDEDVYQTVHVIGYYFVLVCIAAIIVGMVIAYAFSQYIGYPLNELDKVAQKAAQGDFAVDVSSLIEYGGDIGRLSRSFGIMMANLKGKRWEVDFALKTLQKANRDLSKEIEIRKETESALRENEEKFRTLFEAINDVIFIVKDLVIVDCNQRALTMFGRERERIVGETLYSLSPETQPDGTLSKGGLNVHASAAVAGKTEAFDWVFLSAAGEAFFVEVHMRDVILKGEAFVQAVVRDVSERKRSEAERLQLEKNLSQARKLESIGTLAAGIAHEINTPVQFVNDNLHFIVKVFERFRGVLQEFDVLIGRQQQTGALLPEDAGAVLERYRKDVAPLRDEINDALEESIGGLERITTIVNAMKNYSHINQDKKVAGDINQAIESTVIVARNEWRYVADVVMDLDPSLPFIECYLADFNQVIMNILINAVHAIEEHQKKTASEVKGKIIIKTSLGDGCVKIAISDTGTGIPDDIKAKVFDPFFTTKKVGKGTGQGLAIAYQTIVEKHQGKLYFESQLGVGTTFLIELPLR